MRQPNAGLSFNRLANSLFKRWVHKGDARIAVTQYATDFPGAEAVVDRDSGGTGIGYARDQLDVRQAIGGNDSDPVATAHAKFANPVHHAVDAPHQLAIGQ